MSRITKARLLFPLTPFLFNRLSYFCQTVFEIALLQYRRGLQKFGGAREINTLFSLTRNYIAWHFYSLVMH